MRRTWVLLIATAAVILLASQTARTQTYTNFQLEASAPLPWQTLYDPAARLTIGNDDGNVLALPENSSYASVIRYGGAHGLPGLLDEFTIPAEGVTGVFGLARRGCVVTDATSLDACLLVRWQPSAFFGPTVMEAVVTLPTNQVTWLEHDVRPGDVFSIERDGTGVVRFYRSTDVPNDRKRVFSSVSPFTADGSGVQIEPRAAFPSGPTLLKIFQAQERYYCSPAAGCF